jgi:hypothetical protein
MGPTATKDAVVAAAKGASALKTSPTFVELFGKIKTDDSIWFLLNGNAPFLAKLPLGAIGVKPKAVYGSVNLTDGITADVRMRVGSAEEATSFINNVKPAISNPQYQQMVDKLELVADGADVKLSLAISAQKLQTLLGLLGGMMGGLGGMMGGGMGGQ